MEKLPVEFKERWLKALRSGDYKQAKGYLYDKRIDGYCCIGVACRLIDIPITEMNLVGIPDEMDQDIISIDDLPTILVNYHSEAFNYLTYFNDGEQHPKYNPEGKQYSFIEIADYIEQNL